jgi:hypothetical protein
VETARVRTRRQYDRTQIAPSNIAECGVSLARSMADRSTGTIQTKTPIAETRCIVRRTPMAEELLNDPPEPPLTKRR